jgi:hypothetical protein
VTALLLAATPAGAECRLALALGFDVSNSVDDTDYAIQRDGILAALEDPEIRRAFLEPEGRVRLSVFEWGGRRDQALVLPWTEITSPDDLSAVSAALSGYDRMPGWHPTGLGGALDYGLDLLEEQDDCGALTLDLSGDGRNNDGASPERVYARRDAGRVTVNGLAIGGHESDIVIYYRTRVIRGPGAFVEPAETHADFPRAIRRKLARELMEAVIGRAAPGGPEGAGG